MLLYLWIKFQYTDSGVQPESASGIQAFNEYTKSDGEFFLL